MMNEEKCWKLISDAREATADSTDSDEDFLDSLCDSLEGLLGKYIAHFQHWVQFKDAQLHTQDVSAALHLIRSGNVDDLDLPGFRGWIISQGEDVFNKALFGIDSFADLEIDPEKIYVPDMLDIAAEMYEESMEKDMPSNPGYTAPDGLQGIPWTEADLPKRFPKLWKKYGKE